MRWRRAEQKGNIFPREFRYEKRRTDFTKRTREKKKQEFLFVFFFFTALYREKNDFRHFSILIGITSRREFRDFFSPIRFRKMTSNYSRVKKNIYPGILVINIISSLDFWTKKKNKKLFKGIDECREIFFF